MIQATGLRKRYGDVVALAGLDLVVPAGSILALLGPNGAGKTTVVSILTTLLRADEGEATVAGADVRREPAEVRKLIGLSGQYAAVDEQLTGRENLVMIARLYRMSRHVSRARAAELLERFDLADVGDRPVKTYSGGMRRRLDLACALVAEPPVLFLDEPTTGLDPRSRSEMWRVIRELVGKGTTLLLTTQYMEEADQLADDIVVIDQGRKIAQGSADELKRTVGGERIAIAVQRVEDLPTTAEVLREFAVGEVHLDERGRTATAPIAADGATTLAAALNALSARDIAMGDVGLRRPPPRRRVPYVDRPRHRAGAVDRGNVVSVLHVFSDALVIAKRNLIKLIRVPEILVFVVLSPIMFVLLSRTCLATRSTSRAVLIKSF